jgi:hypothetical protein
MKKIFISLSIIAASLTATAQLHIIEDASDLGGKVYMYPSENLIVTNTSKNKGFTMSADFKRKGTEGDIHLTGMIAQLVSIGTCCEKNELILMFADSTKMTLVSWNKWNCEGNAYYNFDSEQAEIIASKPIIKAQMKNGYSFESFANNVNGEDQKYFVKLCADAKEKKVKLVK